MKKRWQAVSLAGLLGLAPLAHGEVKTFDFKDPKGVNAVQFILDSPLEPILGSASGVSGSLRVDPKDPTSTKGRVDVQASSIQMTHPKMTEALHGPDWLDVAKHPVVSFEIKEVLSAEKLEKDAEVYKVRALGAFQCRGVTMPLTVDVTVSVFPGRLGERVPDMKGDLMILRTEFEIKRTDFGIQPALDFEKVANLIRVRLAIVGHAAE